MKCSNKFLQVTHVECSNTQLPAACLLPIFTQTFSANVSIRCRVRSRWERGIRFETRQPQCELGEDSRSISPMMSPLDLVECRPMGNRDEWYHSRIASKKMFHDVPCIFFTWPLSCNPKSFKIPYSFLSWNMDLFQLLESCISTPVLAGSHSAVSVGSQFAIHDVWRHSRHEGFNNGVLLAYSFASNETQPTLKNWWTWLHNLACSKQHRNYSNNNSSMILAPLWPEVSKKCRHNHQKSMQINYEVSRQCRYMIKNQNLHVDPIVSTKTLEFSILMKLLNA